MRKKNIISVLFLILLGLQATWAQKIIIHLPDNQKVEYELSQLDSITFDRGAYLTCPDDKHPHAIDLGLPSGTKWCCCNVGASKPEEYGGYYAWGETHEKQYYDTDNYQYPGGFDIAGTSFDVAHVCMGSPWCMFTNEQLMELFVNCSKQWTQKNGVNGILVTGSNGGQIFLPAAGYREDDLGGVGLRGDYWTSTPNLDHYGLPYYLFFASGGWKSGNLTYWCAGFTVRAICP